SAPSETVGGRAALGGHGGAEVPASSATDRNGHGSDGNGTPSLAADLAVATRAALASPAVGGSGGPGSSVVREFVGEVSARKQDTFGLSPREKEVLYLIAQGRTNREIGERLFISQKTVGVHVGNILAKLDVSGRVEAAAVAIRLGLTEHARAFRGCEAPGGHITVVTARVDPAL